MIKQDVWAADTVLLSQVQKMKNPEVMVPEVKAVMPARLFSKFLMTELEINEVPEDPGDTNVPGPRLPLENRGVSSMVLPSQELFEFTKAAEDREGCLSCESDIDAK